MPDNKKDELISKRQADAEADHIIKFNKQTTEMLINSSEAVEARRVKRQKARLAREKAAGVAKKLQRDYEKNK